MTMLFRSHKNGASHAAGRRTFTLIELLICIAVILILTAMLMPVLSRVRYRAKLVVCMNNQKQMAVAALVYAAESDGRLPYKSGMKYDATSWNDAWTNTLFQARYVRGNADNYGEPEFNDIPLYSTFLDESVLICPLTTLQGPIYDQASSPWASRAVQPIGYQFYPGYAFQLGDKPLNRLTKNMTMTTAGGKVNEFDVLVADVDIIYNSASKLAVASHPDFKSMTIGPNSNNWVLLDLPYRGPIDMNYTRVDGSCTRVNRVTYDDPRLKHVKYKYKAYGYSETEYYQQLPNVESD